VDNLSETKTNSKIPYENTEPFESALETVFLEIYKKPGIYLWLEIVKLPTTVMEIKI
jgi:hypothetical protein